ncbi:MAG: SBBP repeat-containing protein, partial [Bacteroidota bacterium]
LHHTHGSSHEHGHEHQHQRQVASSSRIQAYSYEVKLLATSPKVTFQKKGATKAAPYQFFLGNQSYRWASNVQSYSEVVYQGIYPGIDLRLFKKGSKLKYEFLVAPGADYQKIQLKYQHTHNLQLKEGHLEIPTPFGTVIESHPISFQQVNGKWKKVASSFSLQDSVVSFEIGKNSQRTQRLLIDPELVFSTFSGSFADNWGNTATYDEEGNLYSGGIVFGMGFPTTTGAFDIDFNGNIDMGIIKYNATGTDALYITYLGGIAAETPHSLVVDQNGDLLVLGSTSSNDFPTTAGALQSTFNGGIPFAPFSGVFYGAGSDLIVSKLSNDGTQLLQSTYIGGSQNDGVNLSTTTIIRNYGDSFRGDIITDSLNFIYLATTTESSDFPLVNAYQSTSAGAQEAVVMKISSDLSSIVWSTFLGGDDADFGHSIKLNADNEVYVGGATQSTNFPTSSTAMIPTYPLNSNEKGFITQFDDAGNFLAATYVGANQASQVFFIDLDIEGNVYAFGSNVGSYPVSAGVYQNTNSGQFIHKISSDLTTSLLSTVIGSGDGQPDLSPTAFLVNECGNIYLTGWGGIVNIGSNPSSSTFGLPVTADAFDSNTDGSDFYIMVLEKDFNSLLYATFLGGSDEDHVDGGTSRFAKDGTIYHATCACGGFFDNFPTTPGAWSNTNNSFNCNNAAFKFNTDILQADFQILDPVTLTEISEGCTDLEVILRYDGIGAREATWEIIGLDTISQTTVTDIPYTFRTGGTYPIRLTVRNQASCTQEVVVEKNIEVFPTNFQVIGEQTICFGASVTLSASGTGNTQFAWSPAASLSDTTLANPVASPVDTTLYEVQMIDENGCTTTETVRVNVLPDIQPSFTWQLVKECGQPARIGFVNTSQNADTYTWLIDGQTFDTPTPPPYLYDEESPQEVTLTARNALCSKTITQSVQPEYLTPFSVSAPTTICEGESIQLQAGGSLSYQWSPTERMEGAD